jgi:hypothetical protein
MPRQQLSWTNVVLERFTAEFDFLFTRELARFGQDVHSVSTDGGICWSSGVPIPQHLTHSVAIYLHATCLGAPNNLDSFEVRMEVLASLVHLPFVQSILADLQEHYTVKPHECDAMGNRVFAWKIINKGEVLC